MLMSILLTRRSCRVKTFKRRVNGSAQFPVYKWNVQNKIIKIEIYHFSNVRAQRNSMHRAVCSAQKKQKTIFIVSNVPILGSGSVYIGYLKLLTSIFDNIQAISEKQPRPFSAAVKIANNSLLLVPNCTLQIKWTKGEKVNVFKLQQNVKSMVILSLLLELMDPKTDQDTESPSQKDYLNILLRAFARKQFQSPLILSNFVPIWFLVPNSYTESPMAQNFRVTDMQHFSWTILSKGESCNEARETKPDHNTGNSVLYSSISVTGPMVYNPYLRRRTLRHKREKNLQNVKNILKENYFIQHKLIITVCLYLLRSKLGFYFPI